MKNIDFIQRFINFIEKIKINTFSSGVKLEKI